MRQAALDQPQGTHQLNFLTLLRLRWLAIIGQSVAICGAWLVMDLPLPIGLLTGMLGLEVISNVALMAWSKRGVDSESSLGAVLCLDVMLLTALLALSGGVANPFSILYLMHIALASVMVGERWSWGLVLVSLLSYGLLFLVGDGGLSSKIGGSEHPILDVHQQGMWIAMGITSVFIVGFIQRIRRQVARRDLEIAKLAELRNKQERLASLVTLSAGAAHELSTPLSTIALVARELERGITRHAPEQDFMIEDAQLIRGQVDRCQRILQSMAADAGESMGELPRGVAVGELFEEVLEELMSPAGVRIGCDEEALDERALISPRAMSLAMQGLVRNAREAAMEHDLEVDVTLDALVEERTITILIEDQSGGMSPEVAARAQEPFFSTKPPGRGMGIGLFLASTLCERLGGELRIESVDGEGSTVSLILPRAARDHTIHTEPIESQQPEQEEMR